LNFVALVFTEVNVSFLVEGNSEANDIDKLAVSEMSCSIFLVRGMVGMQPRDASQM
jgi:hypothetical protein